MSAGAPTKGGVQRLNLDTITLQSTAVAATGAEINRTCDLTGRIVNDTGATLTVTEAAHEGRTITLNRAAGQAVTLPAATGSGARYRFYVGTTITSNTTTIKVVGDDTMSGMASGAGAAAGTFLTAADTDTITFNGTTTGGILGTFVDLQDVAADKWAVEVRMNASSTIATPFSATV